MHVISGVSRLNYQMCYDTYFLLVILENHKTSDKAVLHILPSTSEEASGPTYSVVRLCESLDNSRVYTQLITLDSEAPHGRYNQKTFPYGLGPRRLGNSPSMRSWLEKQARVGSVRMFHNHSLWMMPNVYPGNIAADYGIPYVLSPRGCFTEYAMSIGSHVKKLFWPLVQKPSLRSVNLFHATAESEYLDIRRMGFRQPVAVIPNGIDIPDVPIDCGKSGLRTLLFLSRIHPNKGLDLLLPAWKSVQNRFPEWRLLIVGPDENNHLYQVKKLAVELELERVFWEGPVYGKRKFDLMASSDLFILPSYSENFGMVVAESLASGTPAIVLKGAPWHGIEQNEAGWWIDADSESIAACLTAAFLMPEASLRQMGISGRTWMQRDFSWDMIAEKMSRSYDWICEGGDRPDWILTD
jgi:glycosyltransferase involved in cell wall biosynthesis